MATREYTKLPFKYEVIDRKNIYGNQVKAPFINGMNVWDIPVREYTKSVEEAIKSAYKRGFRFALSHLNGMYLGE
jgi:hypothetical protein